MNLFPNVIRRLRKALFPSEHDREPKRFYADGGDEGLRFDYELNSDSLVIDLGGYKGQWTSDIYARFNCRVLVFEPVAQFAASIAQRFRHNPNPDKPEPKRKRC